MTAISRCADGLEPGRTAPPSTSASIAPVTPTAPNVMGPTEERASIRTAERSGRTRNVRRLRGRRALRPARRRGRRPARPRTAGRTHGSVAADVRGRRHRRPAAPGRRRPALLGLGHHGVDRPGGHVAAQHLVEAVALLLDHPHPRPQGALALQGEARRPAGPGPAVGSPGLDSTRPSRSSWARAR